MGEWLIGVRTDDEECAAMLRKHLAGSVVDVPDPPTGYSIVTTPPSPTIGVPLAELRRGFTAVKRSRSPGRLSLALCHRVLAFDRPDPGRPRLRVGACVVPGGVALVAHDLLDVPGLERHLQRHRLAPIDSTALAVDIVSDDVRVAAGAWEWDAGITDIDGPVVAVVLERHQLATFGGHHAGLVATIAELLEPVDHGGDAQVALDGIVRLVRRTPLVVVDDRSPLTVVRGLLSARRESR